LRIFRKRTPHSALRTPHSALRTPHSALRTKEFSLLFIFLLNIFANSLSAQIFPVPDCQESITPVFDGLPVDEKLCKQLGVVDFDYEIGTGTLYPTASSLNNSTLTGNILVHGIFIVDVPLAINDAIVQIDAGGRIDVTYVASVFDPTEGLAISRSYLYSCKYMWQGIRVHYASNLSIGSSSHIEDAETAVFCNTLAGLFIEGTIFNRNRVGIELRNGVYIQTLGYVGPFMPVFQGNFFTCSSPLSSAAGNEVSFAGVRLHNAWLTPVGSSINDANVFERMQYGIFCTGERSRIVANEYHFLDNYIDGINMEYGICDVLGSTFYNNRRNGISIQRLRSLNARSNTFTWDNSLPFNHGNYRVGIQISQTVDRGNLTIDDNEFNGILPIQSGKVFGIWHQGLAIGLQPRVFVNNNHFSLFGNSEMIGFLDYGNYPSDAIYFIAGNHFNITTLDSGSGIVLAGNKPNLHCEQNHFTSGDDFAISDSKVGIIILGSDGLSNAQSHFTNNHFIEGPYLNGYKTAILAINAQNYTYCQNFISNSLVAFGFQGDCMGTNIRLNEAYGSALIEIYGGFIDDQVRRANFWELPNSTSAFASPQATNTGVPVFSQFRAHRPQSTALNQEPYHPFTIVPDVDDEFWQHTPGPFSLDCFFGAQQNEDFVDSKLKRAIAENRLNDALQNAYISRGASFGLFQTLSAMSNTTILPSVYVDFMQTNQNSSVGVMARINDAENAFVSSMEPFATEIGALYNDLSSHSALQTLSLTHDEYKNILVSISQKFDRVAELDLQIANQRASFANSALADLSALAPAHTADAHEILVRQNELRKQTGLGLVNQEALITLARGCPDEYGNLVFKARSLLGACVYAEGNPFIDCGTVSPNATILNQTEERLESSEKQNDTTHLFGPNPADKYIQVDLMHYANTEGHNFEIVNSLGESVKTARCSPKGVCSIGVADLPFGMYTLLCRGLGFHEKFVIAR
jgi:hypothetical protein